MTAGRHAGAVVRGWRAGDAEPVVVAKVDAGGRAAGAPRAGRLDREADALARLGPAAAAAGAALPRVVATGWSRTA